MIPQSAPAWSIHLTQTGGWRSEASLLDEMNVKFVLEGSSIDDYNKELEEPLIKSLAYNWQLWHCAQLNEYQDHALAVGKANEVISSLQLHSVVFTFHNRGYSLRGCRFWKQPYFILLKRFIQCCSDTQVWYKDLQGGFHSAIVCCWSFIL